MNVLLSVLLVAGALLQIRRSPSITRRACTAALSSASKRSDSVATSKTPEQASLQEAQIRDRRHAPRRLISTTKGALDGADAAAHRDCRGRQRAAAARRPAHDREHAQGGQGDGARGHGHQGRGPRGPTHARQRAPGGRARARALVRDFRRAGRRVPGPDRLRHRPGLPVGRSGHGLHRDADGRGRGGRGLQQAHQVRRARLRLQGGRGSREPARLDHQAGRRVLP
mmetsp:Transcript_1379/g.4134  ORF Transcript_1379/g.4134 Transcript_1379/m.4134 type:complete len:226 (-) Transcript_1379:572-1249(-)